MAVTERDSAVPRRPGSETELGRRPTKAGEDRVSESVPVGQVGCYDGRVWELAADAGGRLLGRPGISIEPSLL